MLCRIKRYNFDQFHIQLEIKLQFDTSSLRLQLSSEKLFSEFCVGFSFVPELM